MAFILFSLLYLCWHTETAHLTCGCGSLVLLMFLLTHARLTEGCFGRQEVAEDQFQQGSSTGCRQLGHATAQTALRWDLLDFPASPADMHWTHMVWEQGSISRTSHFCWQAWQQEICCKQSMTLPPFSSLFDFPAFISTTFWSPCFSLCINCLVINKRSSISIKAPKPQNCCFFSKASFSHVNNPFLEIRFPRNDTKILSDVTRRDGPQLQRCKYLLFKNRPRHTNGLWTEKTPVVPARPLCKGGMMTMDWEKRRERGRGGREREGERERERREQPNLFKGTQSLVLPW